jgi:hypothetical protein
VQVIIAAEKMDVLANLFNFIYKAKPEAFEKNVDRLFRIYKKNVNARSTLILVFKDMMSKDLTPFEGKVDLFVDALDSAMTAVVAADALCVIASKKPELVAEHVDLMKEAAENVNGVVAYAPKFFSFVGTMNEEKAVAMLEIMFGLMDTMDDVYKSVSILQLKNIMEKYKSVFQP